LYFQDFIGIIIIWFAKHVTKTDDKQLKGKRRLEEPNTALTVALFRKNSYFILTIITNAMQT